MRPAALLILAAGLLTGRLVAQAADSGATQRPRLTIQIRRDSAGQLLPPLVRGRNLLADREFFGALRNGFAVRFAYRLALWRSATLFDHLSGEITWQAVVVLNPVENTWELLQPQGTDQTFADSTRLATALGAAYPVDLLPPSSGGRYYYVANLDVESLTESELEDVQRWLKGDASRAITGRGDVSSALTRAARMLLIRVSGLPHRSFEARAEIQ